MKESRTQPDGLERRGKLPPIVRAQVVSQTGLWMQRVAMGWLVYRLTDSTRACVSGIVCAASTGYFARRLRKHRHLIHRAFRSRGFHLKEGQRWEWS